MRSVILIVLYTLVLIAVIPFFIICVVFGLREPLMALSKAVLRLSRWILGIRVEVEGRERIDPRGAYVYMSNHLSFLDGPLLFVLIPGMIRVLLKKSVFRIPVLGWGMRFIGFVPVDRKGMKAGKASIDRAKSLMREKGYSFLIFPEGTRSRDGGLLPFRRGGFFLAVDSQAPIVPVSIKGTYELMPRGRFRVKRGTVKVVFHEPVPSAGRSVATMPELMEEVRAAIQSAP